MTAQPAAKKTTGETSSKTEKPKGGPIPHTTFECIVPMTVIRDATFGELRSKRGQKHIVPTGGAMYHVLMAHSNAFRIEGVPSASKGTKKMQPPKMTRKFTPKA